MAPEEVEIVADNQGIDDLIFYLQGIKSGRDHMHLSIDSEINSYPVPNQHKEKIVIVRQVLLEYEETNRWLGKE